MRSVVSKVRLHANSIESTSAALFALSFVVVVVDVEVLLVDVAPDSEAGLPPPPLGGVVWVSTSPVEDEGSTACGDGGADSRRDGSTSWSPGGQSVDVVDSGAVLGCSDDVPAD